MRRRLGRYRPKTGRTLNPLACFLAACRAFRISPNVSRVSIAGLGFLLMCFYAVVSFSPRCRFGRDPLGIDWGAFIMLGPRWNLFVVLQDLAIFLIFMCLFHNFFFLKLFLINLCEEISMYGFFKTKNINIYFYGLYKNTFFLLVCAFKGIWIYIWKHMQETYIFHPCDAVFNKHFLLVIRNSFWK